MKLKKTKLVVKCPCCLGKGYIEESMDVLGWEGLREEIYNIPCDTCTSSGWLDVYIKEIIEQEVIDEQG